MPTGCASGGKFLVPSRAPHTALPVTMSTSLLIALREAFQGSLLLALVFWYPPIRDVPRYRSSAAWGAAAAVLMGLAFGAVPALAKALPGSETWTFWRHVAEASVFFASIVVLVPRRPAPPDVIAPSLGILGFLLFFFEARSIGFIVHDLGALSGSILPAAAAALTGLALGLLPLFLLRHVLARLPFERTFTPASLLMVVGALQIAFGGLGEVGGDSIMVPLQKGLLLFLSEAMKSVQAALLITEHPFLTVDLAGLAQYLASDRIALTLTVLFLMTPPVLILISLFSRSDPRVSSIALGAHRRQKIAAFRQDLSLLAMPVLAAFLLLVVQVHAVTVSLNPLYDPAPVPLSEEEGTETIRIPVASPLGDLGDRKLHRFEYYRGNAKILFLVVLKADGSVGVALDQCEVCRPADWNKDAQGYAQRGMNLVCKYCMTPIAMNTVNTPGGCNPIPLPFRVANEAVLISLSDLTAAFTKAQELSGKGSHL
jgi:uncharacterized membrane protein